MAPSSRNDPPQAASGESLIVTVTLFAALREAAGESPIHLSPPPGARVGSLWPMLVERFPDLAPHGAFVAFAVNHAYVKPDHPLRDGDEVALLPPVSGGAA